LNYLVTLRTRELGVRLALGANRLRVMSLVLGEGVRRIAVGAVVGVVISLIASSRISSILFGVSPRDPVVVTAAVCVLLLCAGLAALVPARRAMTIDPMRAIRDE
jgi:ABC-type antimicrobial peptide transport system permease subunit